MAPLNTSELQARFDRLRSNKAFEIFVISIIVISALVIGVKTYPLPPAVTQAIIFLDWCITFFFLAEIIIRYLGEPDKKRFFHSAWNVFDTLIVVVSLIPIENSDLALSAAWCASSVYCAWCPSSRSCARC